MNPDNWEGINDCYDCGLILAEGVTESPIRQALESDRRIAGQ